MSYVKKNDVLKELNQLSLITVILVVIMLVVSSLIILLLVKKKITEPVNNLTATITKISEGDFTVNINRGGNNEIGVMNNRMFDYVESIHGTDPQRNGGCCILGYRAGYQCNRAGSVCKRDERTGRGGQGRLPLPAQLKSL